MPCFYTFCIFCFKCQFITFVTWWFMLVAFGCISGGQHSSSQHAPLQTSVRVHPGVRGACSVVSSAGPSGAEPQPRDPVPPPAASPKDCSLAPSGESNPSRVPPWPGGSAENLCQFQPLWRHRGEVHQSHCVAFQPGADCQDGPDRRRHEVCGLQFQEAEEDVEREAQAEQHTAWELSLALWTGFIFSFLRANVGQQIRSSQTRPH